VTTATPAPVRIRSRLHPEGKLYELRPAAEMSRVELAMISVLETQVERALRRRRPFVGFAVRRAVDPIVRLVLPEIEESVLQRLPLEARMDVIGAWARVHP
jgi:hypothetical protein